MQTNLKPRAPRVQTREEEVAENTAIQELRRTVLSCLLWENNFYESGESIADRIQNLIPRCEPRAVAELAMEARNKYHLRHAPLWLVIGLLKTGYPVHKVIYEVCQRPDDLTELLSLYWKPAESRCRSS